MAFLRDKYAGGFVARRGEERLHPWPTLASVLFCSRLPWISLKSLAVPGAARMFWLAGVAAAAAALSSRIVLRYSKLLMSRLALRACSGSRGGGRR